MSSPLIDVEKQIIYLVVGKTPLIDKVIELFKNGKCIQCGKKAKLAKGIGWYCTNKDCK